MRTSSPRRALARTDVLAILVCTGMLVAMGTVDPPAAVHPSTLKDARQLQSIHQACIIFSAEMRDVLPTPGLINRAPVESLGQEIPGRGPEDTARNTTANLYSAMIMQNYFRPELAVAPIERNPKVTVMASAGYGWDRYDVAGDVYWDEGFVADLETGSNASYAHLVLFGQRKKTQWRNTMSATTAHLSNRGPFGGGVEPKSFTCGQHGQWSGHVAFADNHVELLRDTRPKNLKPLARADDGEPKRDNLFAFDEGIEGGDLILSFTKAMRTDGPKIQHD